MSALASFFSRQRVWEEVEGIFVAAGQKLYGVMPGDRVRVTASIQYRGPAYSDTFYVGIGEWKGVTWPTDIGLFDEHWSGSQSVSLAAAGAWATYNLTADVLITQIGKTPWTPGWFDIYAKLSSAAVFTPRLDNVIEVILAPEFRPGSFAITGYDKV